MVTTRSRSGRGRGRGRGRGKDFEVKREKFEEKKRLITENAATKALGVYDYIDEEYLSFLSTPPGFTPHPQTQPPKTEAHQGQLVHSRCGNLYATVQKLCDQHIVTYERGITRMPKRVKGTEDIDNSKVELHTGGSTLSAATLQIQQTDNDPNPGSHVRAAVDKSAFTPSEAVTPLYATQHLKEATQDSERNEDNVEVDENMLDALVAGEEQSSATMEIQQSEDDHHQVSLLKSQIAAPDLRGSEELPLSEKAVGAAVVHDNLATINNINNGPEERASNCFQKKGLSRATSFNLTEIAEQLDDDSSEVDSIGCGRVSVNGYQVKPQYEDTLRSIISKHGDIAARSTISNAVCFLFIELLRDTIQKLSKSNILAIAGHELKDMLDGVCDMERVNIEVGFLKRRLVAIYEAKMAMPRLKSSSGLKQSKAEWKTKIQGLEEEVQVYQKQFDILKGKIDTAHRDLLVARAEATKVENMIDESKIKVKHILELGELVSGLI